MPLRNRFRPAPPHCTCRLAVPISADPADTSKIRRDRSCCGRSILLIAVGRGSVATSSSSGTSSALLTPPRRATERRSLDRIRSSSTRRRRRRPPSPSPSRRRFESSAGLKTSLAAGDAAGRGLNSSGELLAPRQRRSTSSSVSRVLVVEVASRCSHGGLGQKSPLGNDGD